MVVPFSGRSRAKRKKTGNTTVLELWSLSLDIISESSILLLVYLFWCCMLCSISTEIDYIVGYSTEQKLILSQNDRWCLFDIASFRSLIHFNFFFLIMISLSFFQRSLQFLLIVWDAIVMVDYIVRAEYFDYCLFIIITREFFHRKQILLSKLMDEWCNFLVSFFGYALTLPLSSSLFGSSQNKQQSQSILFIYSKTNHK